MSTYALPAIVAVTLITVGIGLYGLRFARTTSDFLVASRMVSPTWNAAAIGGEYLSAASFLGVAGLVLKHGVDALWYPVGFAAGYLALLLFVAAPLRRSGAFTLPDFCEVRLGSRRLRKLATAFVLFIGWLYLVPQLQGAGLTLQTITGAPYALGAVIVGIVVTLNVALGGMRSITFVQAFQYWLKLTALAVPVIFLVLHWQADGRPELTAPTGPTFPAATTVTVEHAVTLTLTEPSTVVVHGALDGSTVDGPVDLPAGAHRAGDSTSLDFAAGTSVPRVDVGRRRVAAGLAAARRAGRRRGRLRHVLADHRHVPGHDGAAARARALLHQPQRGRGPPHDPRGARPGRRVLSLADVVRGAGPDLHPAAAR